MFYIVWFPFMLLGLLSVLIMLPLYILSIYMGWDSIVRKREFSLIVVIWTWDYIPDKIFEGWKQ